MIVAFMLPLYRYTESLVDIRISEADTLKLDYREMPPWSDRKATLPSLIIWRFLVLLRVVLVYIIRLRVLV